MFNFVKNEYDRQRCLAYLDMIIYYLREGTCENWNYRPAAQERVAIGIGDSYFIHWHQRAIVRHFDKPEEYWVKGFLEEYERQGIETVDIKTMRIFLDDERDPPSDEWTVVRNSRQFVRLVMENTNYIEEVSFDNDLGEDTWEGYDCARFFEHWMSRTSRRMATGHDPIVGIHTANPAAREKMRSLFKHTDFEVKER